MDTVRLTYINDQGERSEVVDSSLLTETTLGAKSALTYLFTEVGLVSAKTHQFRSMEVRLRTSRVMPSAYASLLYLLADEQPARVIVNVYDEHAHTWHYQLIGDWRAAIDWVATHAHSISGDRHPVKTNNRSPEQKSTKNKLKEAIRFWSQQKGLFDDDSLNAMFRTILAESYVLLTQYSTEPIFCIDQVGQSIPQGIRVSIESLCGDSIWALPDRAFATNCHRTYSVAMATGEPILEDVDVYVYWPNLGHHRRRYQRLVLPIRRPNKPYLSVLSATSSDSGIDLRYSA